jgi:hypothetical protein
MLVWAKILLFCLSVMVKGKGFVKINTKMFVGSKTGHWVVKMNSVNEIFKVWVYFDLVHYHHKVIAGCFL